MIVGHGLASMVSYGRRDCECVVVGLRSIDRSWTVPEDHSPAQISSVSVIRRNGQFRSQLRRTIFQRSESTTSKGAAMMVESNNAVGTFRAA
eukprot:1529601-Rhodomonas_salina.2